MRYIAAGLLALPLLFFMACSRQLETNTNANTQAIAFPSPGATVEASPIPDSIDWEAEIENKERKLRQSKIVFNPPTEMLEQRTETIQARISFRDIGAALAEGLEGRGKPQERPLKVSETMKVTLTGDANAFLIQPVSDEEQLVAGREYAQWEWRVTPLQPGTQRLTLSARAIIFLPGRGDKASQPRVLNEMITVQVDRWYNAKQFFANNWQWLWAVIVVPAAGLLWRRLRKGRRGSPQQQ
jgi:hypothetical protein